MPIKPSDPNNLPQNLPLWYLILDVLKFPDNNYDKAEVIVFGSFGINLSSLFNNIMLKIWRLYLMPSFVLLINTISLSLLCPPAKLSLKLGHFLSTAEQQKVVQAFIYSLFNCCIAPNISLESIHHFQLITNSDVHVYVNLMQNTWCSHAGYNDYNNWRKERTTEQMPSNLEYNVMFWWNQRRSKIGTEQHGHWIKKKKVWTSYLTMTKKR